MLHTPYVLHIHVAFVYLHSCIYYNNELLVRMILLIHVHYSTSCSNNECGAGIQHYAGPVVYQVKHFLEKNKDVQQDTFFDYLETSSNPFAREITKYRVCAHLTVNFNNIQKVHYS